MIILKIKNIKQKGYSNISIKQITQNILNLQAFINLNIKSIWSSKNTAAIFFLDKIINPFLNQINT